MTALITLIIWYGMTPVSIGQYETKEQCWNVVSQLLEHGIGADVEFKFQCIDPRRKQNDQH